MRRFSIALTALGSFLAAGLIMTPDAEAGGLSTARFGGELGHVVGDNPGAIYYNPAAIGATRGFNIMVDGLFAWRTAEFDHPQICPASSTTTPEPCGHGPSNNEYGEPADGIGANYGKSKLANFATAPMLGATGRIPLTEDVALGMGAAFFVPFGGASTWGKNTAFEGSAYPGAVDGHTRWWSIDGTLRSLFISAAASVSIMELIHIGMSGGVAINQVNTIRAKALDNSNNLAAEGRAWIDASDLNGHLGGGVMVTPFKNNDLRLGFSYQSPVGFADGVTMGGTLTIHDGTGQVTEQEIDLHHVWPDIFRLGVAYKPIDVLELRLNGNVQRWSLLQDQCITVRDGSCDIQEDGSEVPGQDFTIINIPRRWNDSFGVRLGASYWLVDPAEATEDDTLSGFELFGGVGYDSNAVPDATLEPALTDFHDVAVNLGGKFTFAEHYALALSYTQIFYVPRDNTGKSELHLLQGDSLGPDAGGKYSQNLGFANLHFIAHFDPWADDKPRAEPLPAAEPMPGDTAPGDTMPMGPAPMGPAPVEPAPPVTAPVEPAPVVEPLPDEPPPPVGEPTDAPPPVGEPTDAPPPVGEPTEDIP